MNSGLYSQMEHCGGRGIDIKICLNLQQEEDFIFLTRKCHSRETEVPGTDFALGRKMPLKAQLVV